MPPLIELLGAHVNAAPWIILAVMLVAGLNAPIPEDAVILGGALVAGSHPELLMPILAALYVGAILGDLECYWLARLCGPRLQRFRWYQRLATPERIQQVSRFYGTYGLRTLLIGRFIPFGARNALFITAGVTRVHAGKVAFTNLAAAALTLSFYFWVYFTFGRSAVDWVAQGNTLLFGAVALGAAALWLRSRHAARRVARPLSARA